MFLGSKFCGHCGAKAVTAEVVSAENAGECPRCKIKLEIVRIDSANIRECTACGGIWSGVETFEELCANKEQQVAVLGYFSDSTDRGIKPATISYVPCPDCKQLMNRSNFAHASGVIIDLCKKHGVWFDRDELPKIIDFITGGGMQRAREKQKLMIDEQRIKLKDEQQKLAILERQPGRSLLGTDKETSIHSIMALLFD